MQKMEIDPSPTEKPVGAIFDIESLVKYGVPYEVAQEEVVWNPQMYLAQLPPDTTPVIKRIQGCAYTEEDLRRLKSTPDAAEAVEEGESKDGDGGGDNEDGRTGRWADQTKALQKILCAPLNPDGSILRENLQTVLNMILPPREWTVEQRKWRQMASCMPGTKIDIIKLEEKLDMFLKHMGARETGLCPVRSKLYSLVFDELIRQVAISCMEQGVLLVRIRNEIRDTIREYENLFASSTAFQIRKTLFAETVKTQMEAKIGKTLEKIEKKKTCLAKLRQIYENIDDKNIAKFEEIRAKHARQVAALKESNQALKNKLEGVIFPRRGGGGAVS